MAAESPLARFRRRVEEAEEHQRHWIEYLPIAEGRAVLDALDGEHR